MKGELHISAREATACTYLPDDIQNKEFMFAIIWNPNNFYVVDRLLNHTKMNSAYFVTNILVPLEQAIFPRGKAPHEKRLVVHLGNCSVHTSQFPTDWLEEHNILRMPHLPYSHDLAPSDFYLFLTVKENSNGFSWLTRTSFLSACKRFWGILILKNWMPYFRVRCAPFEK
jgi:hypothetical protein